MRNLNAEIGRHLIGFQRKITLRLSSIVSAAAGRRLSSRLRTTTCSAGSPFRTGRGYRRSSAAWLSSLSVRSLSTVSCSTSWAVGISVSRSSSSSAKSRQRTATRTNAERSSTRAECPLGGDLIPCKHQVFDCVQSRKATLLRGATRDQRFAEPGSVSSSEQCRLPPSSSPDPARTSPAACRRALHRVLQRRRRARLAPRAGLADRGHA